MKKKLDKWKKSFGAEVNNHRITYFFLLIILALATFVRLYRVSSILGFYYDQGRDAQVIWDLWHKGKFFLIGPTTGIAGIFRGPFYYYLIAPFYLLGNGNPVWPSVFLALTSVLAIILIYYLGVKIQDRTTGIIAVILASFSYYIVYTSRWLSNPTPMLLLSLILIWMMILVTEGKKWAWVIISFVLGLSFFHFGSSGELFYFPAILIFALMNRKKLPNKKIFSFSVIVFLITFLPLFLFDLKHGGILRSNITKFLFTEKSFNSPTWRFVSDKLAFYYDVFSNKIFHSQYEKEKILISLLGFLFIYYLQRLLKNKYVKIILLLLISPIIGLTFFQGNFGNIYDYYLTGYYLPFLLITAVVLGYFWKSHIFGKVIVVYIIYSFLQNNVPIVGSMITDRGDDKLSVAFANQKNAIGWVYNDSNGQSFNQDVYVPPVIPYAYDYLFTWLGTTKYQKLPDTNRTKLLYTLYEPDVTHPERLQAWLDRQKGIGKIEKEAQFGGIVVQRRNRI